MVENKDLEVTRNQPLRKRYLLLVAAAQHRCHCRGRGRLNAQPPNPFRRKLLLTLEVDHRPPHNFSQMGERHILPDAHTTDYAFDTSLSRHVAYSSANCVFRPGELLRRSIEKQLAAILDLRAEENAAQGFSSGTFHAGNPQNFTRAKVESDPLEL